MKYFTDIYIFLLYGLSSGIGLLLLKIGLSKNKLNLSNIMDIILNKFIIIGFLLYAIGFVIWMIILSRYDLNLAFPIAMALFFIISGLGSFFLLKEPISLYHVLGIILCFIGIILIVRR